MKKIAYVLIFIFGLLILKGCQKDTDDLEVNIYPNPAISHIYVESPDADIIELQLFNSLDQLVFDFVLAENNRVVVVGVSFLPSGSYSLILKTTHGEIHRNITIL